MTVKEVAYKVEQQIIKSIVIDQIPKIVTKTTPREILVDVPVTTTKQKDITVYDEVESTRTVLKPKTTTVKVPVVYGRSGLGLGAGRRLNSGLSRGGLSYRKSYGSYGKKW